jgi:short-subunit dehydrogenase
MDINVIGLAMTVKHVLPELKKTKGRLALIGSVAAFVPNPFTSAYGASKAAVHVIGESLQVELLGSGVTCTTIHPGFVDSNIARVDNKGHFDPNAKDPRPTNLMWPTDKAVKDMIRAIDRRKKVQVITGHGKVFVYLGRFFPGIARAMMAKQIKEISKDL